jgi:hypothetical protein
MVFSISPSVTVKEVDLTTVIPAIGTPPAAIAGVFHWGPVNQRVLISSENELAYVFGKPSDFNAETFFTAADFLSYSNALYVVRVVGDGADTANSEYFDAKYPGAIGNSIAVSFVSTPSNGNTFNFETDLFDANSIVDSTLQFNSKTIVVESTEEYDSTIIKAGDVLSIGSNTLGYQELVIESITVDEANTFFDEDANTYIDTYIHTITLNKSYTLPEEDIENVSFKRKWRYSAFVDAAPVASSVHIVVIDTDGKITGNAGQILEIYQNVSTSPTAKTPDGTNNYYKDVITARSEFIVATSETISVASANRTYVNLINGNDGENESNIPFGKLALGYDLYKESNEVDISFILQGKAAGASAELGTRLANYIVSNITDFRKDCMVFVSPRKEDVVGIPSQQTIINNLIGFRNLIQNSSYWVMDSGYKYRYDKYNDKYRWVPLNGDIAGLAARVDPWESPAGYRKGLIKNIIKLAFNPNKTQRDVLYGKDINPVMTQVGNGTVLFGDKTGLGTATGSAFTRINVRRLFITVEKAIATISARFLFEFNDEFTQTQFRNIVNPFLRDIQGKRGIIDFRVVADGTINTPDIIDRNIFRSNIFIKPARSINFIELTFVATRTGVQFEELVGQQF